MPYDGLDLWMPLHSTTIETAGKPLLYIRFDMKAYRCMVCGNFFTAGAPDEMIEIPAEVLQQHLLQSHGLFLKQVGPVMQPKAAIAGPELPS